MSENNNTLQAPTCCATVCTGCDTCMFRKNGMQDVADEARKRANIEPFQVMLSDVKPNHVTIK